MSRQKLKLSVYVMRGLLTLITRLPRHWLLNVRSSLFFFPFSASMVTLVSVL
jgi:hypothetical protein